MEINQPITELATAHLSASVRDKQGNTTRIERRFSVGTPAR